MRRLATLLFAVGVGALSASAGAERAGIDAEWAWIKARFQGGDSYDPASREDPLQRLLAWVPPGRAATIFDRACRPLRVWRKGAALEGYARRTQHIVGNTKTVLIQRLTIDHFFEIQDADYTMYERQAGGGWHETESLGGGYASQRIGSALFAVHHDAAWFDESLVDLRVACDAVREEVSQCERGATRTCSLCTHWALHASTNEPDRGIGFHIRRIRSEAKGQGCDLPCSADDPPADVVRANTTLAKMSFPYLGFADGHPHLFRTRAACRRYRSQHTIEEDELYLWEPVYADWEE
ncbi:MAG: hypothetical protein QM778_34625 [Myxococcales bacterium]